MQSFAHSPFPSYYMTVGWSELNKFLPFTQLDGLTQGRAVLIIRPNAEQRIGKYGQWL